VIKTIEKFLHIIKDYKVLTYEIEGELRRITLQITFADQSQLLVKEYLFPKNIRKYAYHWQDPKGNLRIRWDNAAHWPEIKTFPHHKHQEQEIVASQAVTLDDVLQEIANQMSPR
jgi:hypothetical protein